MREELHQVLEHEKEIFGSIEERDDQKRADHLIDQRMKSEIGAYMQTDDWMYFVKEYYVDPRTKNALATPPKSIDKIFSRIMGYLNTEEKIAYTSMIDSHVDVLAIEDPGEILIYKGYLLENFFRFPYTLLRKLKIGVFSFTGQILPHHADKITHHFYQKKYGWTFPITENFTCITVKNHFSAMIGYNVLQSHPKFDYFWDKFFPVKIPSLEPIDEDLEMEQKFIQGYLNRECMKNRFRDQLETFCVLLEKP